MKSPIRETNNNFKTLSVLRRMIPRGSVVHSFAFFDGSLEIGLARDDRFIVAQENCARYQDPFLRSALFFLLNQCSDSGLISSGVLDNDKYNSFAVSRLTNFKLSNFHIELDSDKTLTEAIEGADKTEADYLLVPAGNYNYGFLHHGKIQSLEITPINHKELFTTMNSLQYNWILIYNFHKEVKEIYKEYKQTMIDKYGNLTLKEESCKELIIANF